MAGGLEEEPLSQLRPLAGRRDGDLVLLVVMLDEVQDDGAGLPVEHKHEKY